MFETTPSASERTLCRCWPTSSADISSRKPAGTWVEAEYLPIEQYAENLCELAEDVKPTLVYVLRHHLPAPEELAQEAMDLARIVAKRLQRPRRNTHIVYEPPGKGRVAFGGTLVR